MGDLTLQIVAGLATAIAGMAAYVARMQRLHAKDMQDLNDKYQVTITKVQEARVTEMRQVTEAAIALQEVAEKLSAAVVQFEQIERQRGRFR